MTVESLVKEIGLSVVCMPSPEREINGAYVGDLLSWVMGKAEPDNVWITIMSNINIVAVASLVDVSCIILAEGVKPDEDALKAAVAKGINVLSTTESAYGIAVAISGIIS